MTRLLAGSAGGGGSVGGAANMAARCWCWACERSAKCEVERRGPGPGGGRGACWESPRPALLALLLLLRGWGAQCATAPGAPPSPLPGAHLRPCRPLCEAGPWPRGTGTCAGSGARGGAGGSCRGRRVGVRASFLTGGLAGAPGVGPVGGRKGGSVLSSRLRSRPETLVPVPALASGGSPSVEPAERGAWL